MIFEFVNRLIEYEKTKRYEILMSGTSTASFDSRFLLYNLNFTVFYQLKSGKIMIFHFFRSFKRNIGSSIASSHSADITAFA